MKMLTNKYWGSSGFVLDIKAFCSSPVELPYYLEYCRSVFPQYHIANTDFSHPLASPLLFWLEHTHSLAEYLCCRLFFPKCIVTISLHFSKMNLILLSSSKRNDLRFVYTFLICVLVLFYGYGIICKRHLFPQRNVIFNIIK